jgi:dihydroorotate dehydrogenase
MSRPHRTYHGLFRYGLSRMGAESAHRLGLETIRGAGGIPGVGAAIRRTLAPRNPVLRVRAFGLDLPGPLGLAAGFDKDAQSIDGLAALGFSFVEIGTVTAQAQTGNPRPRLFRLPADRALINRMGFNNLGAAAVAARLRARLARAHIPIAVGVNIGRSRDVPEHRTVDDYVAATIELAPVADYLVVNVSSPNTPGLRELQAVAKLRPLLEAVGETANRVAGRHVPLLVKISPDLTNGEVLSVADMALDYSLHGVIATNTTTLREGLATPAARVAELGEGGLSGPPLRARSLEMLRILYARVGDRLVLVSVGGLTTAEDAYERVRAGATLLQAYTAFIYEGPLWASRLQRDLAVTLQRSSFDSVADAVGTEPKGL